MERIWSMNWPCQLVLILFLVFGLPTIVGVCIVALVRRLYRASGHEQVYENGIMMTDTGIEYLGFLFTGTRKKSYEEIDSVQLIPYYKLLISKPFFRYGICTRWVRGVNSHFLFGKILVIRLKHPNPIQCLFFTPKDAAVFYKHLKSRI